MTGPATELLRTIKEGDAPDEQKFQQMQGAIIGLINENDLYRESIADTTALIAKDNEGWDLVRGMGQDLGPEMKTMQELCKKTRALAATNPMVKNGVLTRIGYVWGEGVDFRTDKSERSKNNITSIMKANRKFVFSPPAQEQLEMTLATDGNAFFMATRGTKRIIRVPFEEITGVVHHPDTHEEITYFRRAWQTTVMEDNKVINKTTEMWFPAVDLDTKDVPDTINGVEVSKEARILHVAANKQSGWTWGLPDMYCIMLWARAYKAFLESNWTLTMALARWAFKVTQPNAAAAVRSAAHIVAPIESGGTGDTAAMGAGGDLVAVNKAGASLDYNAGKPLAGMVAAGLSISIEAVMAETGNVSETLSRATVKVMTARQSLWDLALTMLFEYYGVTTVEVVFPPVRSDPVHRDVQSIVTAANTGVLHPQEVRDLILVAMRNFGTDFKDSLPKAGAWQKFATGLDNANPGTTPQDTPNPAGGPEPGPQSDGDNQMRKDDKATSDK